MAFLTSGLHNKWAGFGLINKVDPLNRVASTGLAKAFAPGKPPPVQGPPNPNDAANAAQSLTDQMRMRRGMLSNIYAGGQAGASSQPVTGSSQLGT